MHIKIYLYLIGMISGKINEFIKDNIQNNNQLIHQVFKMRIFKNFVTNTTILFLSLILQNIFYFFITLLFQFNNTYLDYIYQSIFSIVLSYYNYMFINVVNRYQQNIFNIVRNTVNNWSIKDYKTFYKYFVLSVLTCLFAFFYFVEVNSSMLCRCISQYILIFLFFDLKKKVKHIKINDYKIQPTTYSEIIEDEREEEEDDYIVIDKINKKTFLRHSSTIDCSLATPTKFE